MHYWLYLASISLGGLGAFLIAHYGHILKLVDRPNARSSHSKPTPKGGGIGILAAFLLSCLILRVSFSFWFPATVVSLLALVGDRVEIAPRSRLAIQFLAAIFFVSTAVSRQEFLEGHILLGYMLVVPLSVFVVGTANFYNFMDGIDGIAGITGIVGFGLIGFFAIALKGDTALFSISISISCACLGFLPFNMGKRAKVFMGDVGAILLGFAFAETSVLLSISLLDFVCLTAFLFPFYADELTTMAIRLHENESLTKPHRRHIYQILANERGIEHWKISAGYGILQLAIGAVALSVKPLGTGPVITMLLALLMSFAVLTSYARPRLSTGITTKG